MLCNMTLDGLEDLVKMGNRKKVLKINIIRYAGDFIITSSTPEVLMEQIKPRVIAFLAERGVDLSTLYLTLNYTTFCNNS